MMAVLIHIHDPFDPTKRAVHRLERPTTVRRLVAKHKALRRHTTVFRPGGFYGRRLVREFRTPTLCLLNGKGLSRAAWKKTTVGAGDVVTFYAAPLGGGGGGGGSNPLAILGAVALIALTVAAPYLAGPAFLRLAAGTFAFSAATVGITLAGSAIIYGLMALFAPPAAQPQQQIGMGTDTQTSPTYSLSIQGNTARLEQPIPELIGRHRIFPDFVGQPYIQYVDNEQYIHMGLAIGIGEYEIEDGSLKIGETPIASFEEIDYAVIEPGGAHDVDIWDPRWVVSQDIATIRLPGDTDDPPSPWKGPFIANPPETTIDRIEVDFIFPRGLFGTGAGPPFYDQSAVVDIEAQEIDADGTAIGAWTALETALTFVDLEFAALRSTHGYDAPSPGRWQVRVRRTDTDIGASTSAGANEIDWAGLRGRLMIDRTFEGMTTLDVVMKATGDLNSATSRKVNLIATRKLPTWDDGAGAMTTALAATRNPCDAMAYIALGANGGRLAESEVDLAGIYENRDFFDEQDPPWTFDFVFDQSLAVSEALARVARAVVAERVVQGQKLRLVRDVEAVAPVAMFGPRNIRQGTVELNYAMVDQTTADALICTYIDPVAWKPKDATIAFDDSPQEKPSRITLHGITNRTQARTVGWWLARGNRYRRRVVKWSTEMEGLAVLFGDAISFSHDVPRWGQSMEVLEWDDATSTMTLSDQPDFSAGGTHYIAIRDSTGMLTGPFEATAVDDEAYQIVVGDGDLPEIYTGGDRERTFVQFGPGEAYARRLKVKTVSPRSEEEAEIVAFDDDSRMYDPIPDDDVDDGIVEYEDIEVHVDADTSDLNLRTLANAAGYVGVAGQAVTVTIDAGIEVHATVPTAAAVRRGSWPADYAGLTLVNLGTISGAGGAGGATNAAGQAGGTALDASTGAIAVDNTDGTIQAGGGGGGGGGLVGATVDGVFFPVGGGSGGGGQGHAGGSAGSAAQIGTNILPGTDGTAGTDSAPGTGGAGASVVDDDSSTRTAPSGGGGGEWGEAGMSNGGAAGKAVAGNANVTWSGTGAIVGTIA